MKNFRQHNGWEHYEVSWKKNKYTESERLSVINHESLFDSIRLWKEEKKKSFRFIAEWNSQSNSEMVDGIMRPWAGGGSARYGSYY